MHTFFRLTLILLLRSCSALVSHGQPAGISGTGCFGMRNDIQSSVIVDSTRLEKLNSMQQSQKDGNVFFYNKDQGSASPISLQRAWATVTIVLSALILVQYPSEPALAKSYSQNARNFERLSAGDSSAGSVYDNNPKTETGQKRRAMTGCKIPSARQEAALTVLGIKSLSEKDCNTKVLGGETEFMLQAMRNLECPTCPYGVFPDRNQAER